MKHSAKALARQASAQQAGARQAGAGQAGRPGTRRVLNQLPYLVVLAGVVVGLATMRGTMQSVKGGTLVIAGALLAGAVARMLLPEGRAGMLGSRRRLVDVAALATLGVGLLIAGLVVKV